jgi:hypothetical protein
MYGIPLFFAIFFKWAGAIVFLCEQTLREIFMKSSNKKRRIKKKRRITAGVESLPQSRIRLTYSSSVTIRCTECYKAFPTNFSLYGHYRSCKRRKAQANLPVLFDQLENVEPFVNAGIEQDLVYEEESIPIYFENEIEEVTLDELHFVDRSDAEVNERAISW